MLGVASLTLLVTCRRPTAAVQFKQIRTRAAVKWNGLILIQASSAARCSGKVAVPQIHPPKEETWMNCYTPQHPHYCGLALPATALSGCILAQGGTNLGPKKLPTPPEAWGRLSAPSRDDLGVGGEGIFTW